MVGRLHSFWNGQCSLAMVVSRRVYRWFYRQWQVWWLFGLRFHEMWGISSLRRKTHTHTHILYMRWCDLLIVGIGSLNNTIGFENKLGDCTPMLKFRRFNMVCVLYSHKRSWLKGIGDNTSFPAGPCQIPHWMFQYPGWRKIVGSWHAESTRTQGNHHIPIQRGKPKKKSNDSQVSAGSRGMCVIVPRSTVFFLWIDTPPNTNMAN